MVCLRNGLGVLVRALKGTKVPYEYEYRVHTLQVTWVNTRIRHLLSLHISYPIKLLRPITLITLVLQAFIPRAVLFHSINSVILFRILLVRMRLRSQGL